MRVVKVGGSLFDLPELAARLRPWVPALFVAGGGDMADAVRALHRIHALPEVASHWLALRTCTLHAHFLAHLLDLPVVADPRDGPGCLDAFAFCEADEANTDHLPHTWEATSDSLAARVAEVLLTTVPQTELVLLKSTDGPLEALVDPVCPGILRRSGVPVRIVNLRA
jgi:aspartokinase-like uncharacterized kinase